MKLTVLLQMYNECINRSIDIELLTNNIKWNCTSFHKCKHSHSVNMLALGWLFGPIQKGY